MAQMFSNVYSIYYKQQKLKFGTRFITYHYVVFSRKINYFDQ